MMSQAHTTQEITERIASEGVNANRTGANNTAMSKSGIEKNHTVGTSGTSGLIQIPNALSPSGEP
jgi:hypothetical protein